MHITYNGWDISLTATTVIALITFAKWLISRTDKKTKKKNVPKTPSQQA